MLKNDNDICSLSLMRRFSAFSVRCLTPCAALVSAVSATALSLLVFVSFTAPNVAVADSLPECEKVDSAGLKINECTDPTDIQYWRPLGGYIYPGQPAPATPWFASPSLSTTATEFVQGFNAVQIQLRDWQLSQSMAPQWEEISFAVGSPV